MEVVNYEGSGSYQKLIEPRDIDNYPPGSRLLASLVKTAFAGRVGAIVLVAGYDPALPQFGTSPMVFDRRPIGADAHTYSSAQAHAVVSKSIREQLESLQAALSLNKSQLAQVLAVSRPTLYDWFQGKQPKPSNADRLQFLLQLLAREGISGSTPLNARFVRRPLDLESPTLIAVLASSEIDEEQVRPVLAEARRLTDDSTLERKTRDSTLRAKGFGEVDEERRKAQLARNVALLEWPKSRS